MRITLPITPLHLQRGSTLLVGLVMLVLLTLMAISAMNATTSGIQAVGNAQVREEANAAAQEGIEKIISSNFTASPAASAVTVTFNGASYTAQVETPVCKKSVALTNSSLNASLAADQACLGSGAASNTGIMNASGVSVAMSESTSWCYQQQWDIRATVADANTGANTAVHQGISLKVPAGTNCP